MNITELTDKAINCKFLSFEEALFLYKEAKTSLLIFIADEIRKKINQPDIVTWIIDMNVNITNVCIAGCKFCNFHRSINQKDVYITSIEEYDKKINLLRNTSGNQLLLQGGLHPKLNIDFYTSLFSQLKDLYPDIILHALGPPEIVHLSKLSGLSYREVLEKLHEAGLDSLPGAGAEILDNEIRKKISPGKCSADEWLEVMRQAHKLNLLTTATMMYGHIESEEHRIAHLIKIRNLQAEKPEDSTGFISFIPWTFQYENTVLKRNMGIGNSISPENYVRMIAISRIILNNIKNIQASWLTVGKHTAQLCLHAGANDFGSIMIEENVVSVAGANYNFDKEGIQKAIKEAGFTPVLRNQKFERIIF